MTMRGFDFSSPGFGGFFPGNPGSPTNPLRPMFGPPRPPNQQGGRDGKRFGAESDVGFDFSEDFFKDLLEEERRAPFFSTVNRLGGTGTPVGRFFNTQFQNFENEFFGKLGSQIQGGELPTLRFNDFLSNIDFDKRFRSLAPSLRGQGNQARFRPPTQFRF